MLERLEACLGNALPGRAAQYRLAPVGRAERERESVCAEAYRESAVMILLNPMGGEHWRTPLTLRPDGSNVHARQVALPGGKREACDRDLWETALRETEEELGVSTECVRPLGRLTSLCIPVSRFKVTPFVGYLESPSDGYSFDPQEVASLFHLSWAELLRLEAVPRQVHVHNGPLEVPSFQVHGHVIWGATAMILAEWQALCRVALGEAAFPQSLGAGPTTSPPFVH